MQYQIISKFILTLIMLWSSSTLLAAGFNCAKASTAIEKAIHLVTTLRVVMP